jgi:signal transduction histidine kinase
MDFAVLAHDMRAPLTAMLGHTQLLAIEGLSDAGRRRLEIIEAQIHRLTMMLDSCEPAEHPAPQLAPVDVSTTIRSVVGELEATWRRRRIDVIFTGEQTLPCVPGNGGDLQRLFMNVLTNAVDATADGGLIVVHTQVCQMPTVTAEAVEIRVADTGRGIDADLLPRVFERGFTTKAAGHGNGLGLAICQQIVRAHHGWIDLQSEAGHGTTVHMRLPVQRRPCIV